MHATRPERSGALDRTAWVLISLVIVQFDHAPLATVGVLLGLMLVLAGA